MSVAPTPAEIYRRAVDEGQRRLDAKLLELVATGFNAGFTVVFGVAALGIVHALTEPGFGPEAAKVFGSLAFGVGMVYLVVSRSELFAENFFDPVATVVDRGRTRLVGRLLRLWGWVLALNLLGAAILVAVLSVDGVMPAAADRSLRTVAEEILAKDTAAAFANALVGGALVTLLSFLLQAVDQVLSRIVLAFSVGFVLAVGPFAHVSVTAAHLFFAAANGGHLGAGDLVQAVAIALAGNLIGGLSFVTLSHIAQARSEGG